MAQQKGHKVVEMCARFSLHTASNVLATLFDVPIEQQIPRFNIAPTQPVVNVYLDKEGTKAAESRRWGLIPAWASDEKIGVRMINARSETVATLPAFREAYQKRRCVILADGFYEWREEPLEADLFGEVSKTYKQPYHFRRRDEMPFGFAGLWERWHNAAGERIETCCVLTTGPNEFMAEFHDRMPVILEIGQVDLWLGAPDDSLLVPCTNETLECLRIGRAVSNPRVEGPELLLPA